MVLKDLAMTQASKRLKADTQKSFISSIFSEVKCGREMILNILLFVLVIGSSFAAPISKAKVFLTGAALAASALPAESFGVSPAPSGSRAATKLRFGPTPYSDALMEFRIDAMQHFLDELFEKYGEESGLGKEEFQALAVKQIEESRKPSRILHMQNEPVEERAGGQNKHDTNDRKFF